MGNPLFVVGLVAATMVLALLGHPIVTDEVYTANDLAAFHLPTRVFYARCLAEGHSRTSTPASTCTGRDRPGSTTR
jgi:hypothetical protein